MRQKFKIIGYLVFIVALLPVLGGCNEEDDIVEIFTGKTWKLSYIGAEGTHVQYNFWGEKGMNSDNPAFTKSMGLLKEEGNFTLTFRGSELIGDTPGGSFQGKVTNGSISGTWKANGKDQSLNIYITGNVPAEKDVLAKNFLTGLTNAFRYEGDSQSLLIYYHDGNSVKFMGFKPNK